MSTAQVRVRISTNPPLPPLRAWFPLTLPPPSTISSFKSLLSASLPAFRGVPPSSLLLSIDGFVLLDNSELTVVRDGDLICVGVLDLPSEGATAGPSHVTQKRLEPAASRKRKRRMSTPSSSSSESESESTTTSSGSESESESETSDSESTSDSDEPSLPRILSLQKVEPPKIHPFDLTPVTPSVQPKPGVVHSSIFVPPGYGKPQTRSRNLRRRVKRMHEREAPGVSAGRPLSGANAVVPGEDGQVQAIAPAIAKDSRDAHSIPALLSLTLRNKNKAKNFKSLIGKPLPPKIIFGDQEGDASGSTCDAMATPVCLTSAEGSSKPQIPPRRAPPRLIPPSSRSSLPPNLFVTSIDVEAGLHGEKKKRKMRIEYGNELEGQGRENGDISLDYGDDVDTHKMTAPEPGMEMDIDRLSVLADKYWATLEKPTSESQITREMIVVYKALGINPVTYTPEQCLTVGRVVSCDNKMVVVRPLRAREQVSFGGPVGEEDPGEETHTWDDIINGDWRLFG